MKRAAQKIIALTAVIPKATSRCAHDALYVSMMKEELFCSKKLDDFMSWIP